MKMFKYRPAVFNDVALIHNSWLKHYADSDEGLADSEYTKHFGPTIREIIRVNKTLVVCNETDSEQLFGFITFGQAENLPIIHFVYVKGGFRRQGIATALFTQILPKYSAYVYSFQPRKWFAPNIEKINTKLGYKSYYEPRLRNLTVLTHA